MVLGKGFEPLLTAHLANRGYKSRRATITLPKHTLVEGVGFEPTHRFKGDEHLSRMPISATHPTFHIEAYFSLCGRRRGRLEICFNMAEAVRFELTDPFGSAVFKTAGLNHSPKLPW